MKYPVLAFLCLALSLRAAPSYDQSGVPLEVDAPRAGMTKIVLLAGGPSSKAMAHEYFAGCALLLDWLKQQPGVWPVMARGWPANERVLEGAKCVVYFGDGGGKQPFADPKRWAVLSRLMAEGAGLVLLHQAMDLPAGPDGSKIKGWLGAVYHSDIGSRGHWDMDFKAIPAHEVTRGVKPFAAPADGWLYNLHFAPTGVTPLLTGAVPDKSRSTADAKKHAGREEVIAWSYTRPDGGRGFGFTGADLHQSWSYPSQRTLVLNGILWAARLPVPAGGVQVALDPANLERNLDDKRNAAPAAKAAKKKK
ncbi:MAG: ThuA domain-containing protein [Gammaproteobacteria bacterium]|nr:ThuA domain-containing protein [Gammaproteobacteria bacterium]